MWRSRCCHAEPVAGTAETLELYCTDDYAPYDTLLPVGRHYIGKDETVAIERVNSRLRHWFARFRPVWCRKHSRWSTPPSHCLPPITSIEQRQNSRCHWLLNTLLDQRCADGKRYPLEPLLLFTVLALLSGATSYRHTICFLEQRRTVLSPCSAAP